MPMSNTVSHAYHEKSNSCFPHVPVHMTVVTIVAPLASPSGRRSSSNTTKNICLSSLNYYRENIRSQTSYFIV